MIISDMMAIEVAGIEMSLAAESSQIEIMCQADGSKAFSPALTSQQICDLFRHAFVRTSGTIRVELNFSLRGIASARASRLRNGQWTSFPLFEMAVMDRRFNAADVGRLAGEVMRGIAPAPATEEN